jgi:hypothetical protein
MRRATLVAVAAVTLGLVVLVQPAFGAPTLTLTPRCDDPEHPFGVEIGGSGFPPNQEILVLGRTATGPVGVPLTFAFAGIDTDASGNLRAGSLLVSVPVGLVRVLAYESHNGDTVADPDEPLLATAFIDNPCGAPSLTKESCTDGGWRSLGFRNQGQCVAFVEHSPRR